MACNVGEGQRRDGGRRSLFGDTGRAHALNEEAFALDVTMPLSKLRYFYHLKPRTPNPLLGAATDGVIESVGVSKGCRRT